MRSALIVGRSRNALVEYAAALALWKFDEVLAVNAIGVLIPDPIDHWVSFHVDLFDHWVRKRAAAGYPDAGCFWGALFRGKRLGESKAKCRPLRFAKCLGGSSGFLATCVALDYLKADAVVLAGIPMVAEAAHNDDDQLWKEANNYWGTWEQYASMLHGRVKSMSGRTRDMLGEPTLEWLQGVEK